MDPTTKPRIEPNGPARARFHLHADLVAVAASILAAVVVAILVLPSPSHVGQLTVANASEYDVGVEVTGPHHDGWMPVATVAATTTATVEDVFDQGDVWIFRFRAQGVDAGEQQFTRAQLSANGWTVQVPAQVVDRLRTGGVKPSACVGQRCDQPTT